MTRQEVAARLGLLEYQVAEAERSAFKKLRENKLARELLLAFMSR